MKKVAFIIFLASLSFANAQVIIGDATGTATTKTSVLLEFANTNNKGIIVPYVRTLPTTPAEGTILLDVSTATLARMKYYNGTWQDLSGQDADITSALLNQPTGIIEASTSKVIIGNPASTADGVLVLESPLQTVSPFSKIPMAMVLPTVSDVQNIPSPSPGMMVYVNKAGAKRLAVYNGSKWSFWQQ